MDKIVAFSQRYWFESKYGARDNFFLIFLHSSMVEHTAVNRGVVGSSPTVGAYGPIVKWFKTLPFHGSDTGSNPVGIIKYSLW